MPPQLQQCQTQSSLLSNLCRLAHHQYHRFIKKNHFHCYYHIHNILTTTRQTQCHDVYKKSQTKCHHYQVSNSQHSNYNSSYPQHKMSAVYLGNGPKTKINHSPINNPTRQPAPPHGDLRNNPCSVTHRIPRSRRQRAVPGQCSSVPVPTVVVEGTHKFTAILRLCALVSAKQAVVLPQLQAKRSLI